MNLIPLATVDKYQLAYLLFAIVFFVGGSAYAQKTEKTLFTRIQAVESGIQFANLVPENDSMNIIAHPNHWNGGGVAIGDFNNDQLPDIYFTGNYVSDRLYLNKGSLRFEDVTSSSGVDMKGGWKTGVTLVDINKDGWLDIYVCRAGPNNFAPNRSANLFYLNNGDKTFTETAAEYGIDDSGLSIQAVFFDMDNDGDEDLFVINNNHELSFGSNIYSKKVLPEGVNRLYRNNGNGTFDNVSESAGILSENALSLNAVAADLNNDGLKDIYVSNDLVSSDHVYMNQGNGIFEEKGRAMFKHYSSNAMGSDIADFNNDGLADVLVVDMFPENAERQKNQAGITNDYFESMVRLGHHPQYVRNTLSMNNGNGTFSDVAHMAGVAHTDWSWCPLFADFDNDGLKDILITNSLKKNILDNDFRVYKMDSIMRFVSGNKKSALYKALNRTKSLNLMNYIFKNDGELRFTQKMEDWGLNEPINTTSAAYGDLDNDGDLDLVYNNMDTIAWLFKNNAIEIYDNSFLRFEGKSSLEVRVFMNGTMQSQQTVGARGYQSFPESIIHFGLKKGVKPDSVVIRENGRTVRTIKEIQAGTETDLNKDLVENLFEIGGDSNRQNKGAFFQRTALKVPYQHKENRYDDFKREPLLYEKHSQPGPCSCKGDINNDGLDDIYVSGSKGNNGKLFTQNRDGTFQEVFVSDISNHSNQEDGPCVFFDFDGDGLLDLYVSSSGYELKEQSELLRDRVYLNQGQGNLKWSNLHSPKFLSVTTCVKPRKAEDGSVVVFVGSGAVPGSYPNSVSSHILRYENGNVSDVTAEAAPELRNNGLVQDAIWTDYSNDGDVDLIVVGHWMPITFYKSDGKILKKDLDIDESSGFWNAIASSDVDSDGDTDFIVGNRGVNTRLSATKIHPLRIYSSDYDENGRTDAIMTYYVQGSETVIHTRDALLDQIIRLKKQYLTYTAFAGAKVQDIVGEDAVEKSNVYSISELHSSVLINDGNGKFSLQYLPIHCQKAPVRAIAVADIDEDGNDEIVLAGNSTDSHFTYGKDQASQGILLKATESEGLKAYSSLESGLLLDGEVTSMYFVQMRNSLGLIAFPQFKSPIVYKLHP